MDEALERNFFGKFSKTCLSRKVKKNCYLTKLRSKCKGSWKAGEGRKGKAEAEDSQSDRIRAARNWRWFKLAALSTRRLTYLPPALLNTPSSPSLSFFPPPRPCRSSTILWNLLGRLSAAFILFVAVESSFLSSSSNYTDIFHHISFQPNSFQIREYIDTFRLNAVPMNFEFELKRRNSDLGVHELEDRIGIEGKCEFLRERRCWKKMEEGKTSYFSSLYPIFARLAATINSGRVSFRRVKFSILRGGRRGWINDTTNSTWSRVTTNKRTPLSAK